MQDNWDNLLYTSFIPTYNCNARCYYCSMKCYMPRVNYPSSISDFTKLLNFLKIQEQKDHIFEFFGGEPTTHRFLHTFITMLDSTFGKHMKEINILTNLLKPFNYFERVYPKSVKFSCSFHSSIVKNPDDWFRKLWCLEYRGHIKDVKLILTPFNVDEIEQIIKKYKVDEYERFEVVILEQLEGTEWAYDMVKRFPKTDYIGNYRPKKSFKGQLCNSRFRIDHNGDVHFCWRKFNDENIKPILNVFIDDPVVIPDWHVCYHNDCDICDIEYTKYTFEEFKEQI